MHHGTGEYVGILLAAKVESVDLPGISPLVEGLCGLVVLEPLGNGTVYYHLEKDRKGEREGIERDGGEIEREGWFLRWF